MSRMDITHLSSITADVAGVERFAQAMAQRLDDKRLEGRSGWNDPDDCTEASLCAQMSHAINKRNSNLVDIANYAMMIWNRQHPTG